MNNNGHTDALFNPKDQKVLVKYLFFMRNKPTEIHKLLTAVCGITAADYKIVLGWIRELSHGNDENEEDIHTVSEGPNGIPLNLFPHDPTDPAMIQRVEFLITNDKRITLDKIAEMTQISKTTALNAITSVLGLKRVCERWVPRLWTPEQRAYRVEVSKQLYDKFDVEGDDFLEKIIVGDETFIQYYTPDKLPTHTAPHRRMSRDIADERYRPSVEPITVVFIFFYDFHGLLCMHQVKDNKHVDGEYYANFIRNEVVPAIKRKRKGVNLNNLYLLHDNTPVHNSLEVKKALKDLDLKALPHPPASPDMEPIEYFFINHIKSHLRGTPFSSSLAIGTTIQRNVMTLSDVNYAKSFKSLVNRWDQIIDSRGLYVL